MKPSADSLQLGNYLAALAQWVKMQDSHEAIYSVADLHAITVGHDPKELQHRTRVTAAQYLAAGVDPKKSLLFVQSHVPQHAELAWVLSCLTGFGEASRMTQFKDVSHHQGTEHATVGLFSYPMLMAADILLYRAHDVPVGEDQKQHLELTRTLASRFNTRFGDTLVVPEPKILPGTARIMDLQNPTSKMSKSAESQSGLLQVMDDPKVVRKRIKSAVTDAEREIRHDREHKPGISNLLDIHSAISGETVADLEVFYRSKGYGDLKVDVADLVAGLFTPVREETLRYLQNPAALDEILAEGAAKAEVIAEETLAAVYDAVGFLPRFSNRR